MITLRGVFTSSSANERPDQDEQGSGPERLAAGSPQSRAADEGLQTLDLPSGSSFFLSLPSMYGLHGLALTGAGVFHTVLNWPLACTSPMNTLLCRWWFFSSIFET